MPINHRRTLLKAAGILGAGYTVKVFTGSLTDGAIQAVPYPAEMPWLYHPLAADTTAQLAYENYPGRGCMFAVVSSIVGQLARRYGDPYQQFPLAALQYGHGGVGGYGSLCGALNGGALVLGLFLHDKAKTDAFANSLYKWYEQTPLPNFVPSNPTLSEEVPLETAESVLCHVSVARWCMKAQAGPQDAIRTELCRRLSGEVAAKVVTLLNECAESQAVPAFQLDAASKACMKCHGAEEAKMFQATTKMGCTSCHTAPHGGQLMEKQ